LSTPLHIFSRSDLTSALPTFNLTSNLYGFTSKKNATVVGVAPRSRWRDLYRTLLATH